MHTLSRGNFKECHCRLAIYLWLSQSRVMLSMPRQAKVAIQYLRRLTALRHCLHCVTQHRIHTSKRLKTACVICQLMTTKTNFCRCNDLCLLGCKFAKMQGLTVTTGRPAYWKKVWHAVQARIVIDKDSVMQNQENQSTCTDLRGLLIWGC